MGKPNGSRKKQTLQSSNGSRRMVKKTTTDQRNSIGKFFTSHPAEHNLKLGVNIFDNLSINDKQNKQKSDKQLPTTKNYLPPPLIVTGDAKDLHRTIDEIGITKFSMKNMTIGTKVFVENDNDFAKISSHLKTSNIEFYTHGRKDQKVCKTVLSGLPEISTELIRDELAALNIHPIQIVQMRTQNPNPHRALYLLHLNSNDSPLQDEQKIKSILHTIVKWSKYKPRSRGPTQCRNCSMYGHGTQNCFRRATCTLCAKDDHNQQTCPLKELPIDASPMFKCSYCTKNNIQPSNHRASDINCPGRKLYMQLRKSGNNQQLNNKVQQQPQQLPRNQNKTNQFKPAPPPPPLTQSYRNAVLNPNEHRSEQNDRNGSQRDDELFSTAELFKIFTNAIEDIRNCRTKLDQIQVIAKLINHVLQ